jgi:hypothetical protein
MLREADDATTSDTVQQGALACAVDANETVPGTVSENEVGAFEKRALPNGESNANLYVAAQPRRKAAAGVTDA